MSSIRTYSPSQVMLVISGYVAGGWSEIEILANRPAFAQIDGIRGKNTRVGSSDTSAKLTINIPITNSLNFILHKIHEFDKETGNGRVNILVRDYLTGEVFESSSAYITSEPSRIYKSDVPEREWVFNCMTTKWAHDGANWSLDSLVDFTKTKLGI